MGTGKIEVDWSNLTEKENPTMEKYFRIAGKCRKTNNWHSADSFDFNTTGPGEYDYNHKCPECGQEISHKNHMTLDRIERDYGLGREKEHPLSIFDEHHHDYQTEELEETDDGIVWIKGDKK